MFVRGRARVALLAQEVARGSLTRNKHRRTRQHSTERTQHLLWIGESEEDKHTQPTRKRRISCIQDESASIAQFAAFGSNPFSAFPSQAQ